MNIPEPLRREIIEFLCSLPNVGISAERQALINAASLDKSLYRQIDWEGSTATFFQNLLPVLLQYGPMSDNRHPLIAVFTAAKTRVDQDTQRGCDDLIARLRELPGPNITSAARCRLTRRLGVRIWRSIGRNWRGFGDSWRSELQGFPIRRGFLWAVESLKILFLWEILVAPL